MHLRQQFPNLASQFFCEWHRHSAADFPIVEGSLGNVAAQHFLQAHGLTAELERVPGVLPGTAPLILHRVRLPYSLFAPDRNTGSPPMIFQHIAFAGHTQRGGKYTDAPGDEQVAPALPEVSVVGILMHQRPVHRAEILRPLLLNMDQRPLPAAEFEMLQPGQL